MKGTENGLKHAWHFLLTVCQAQQKALYMRTTVFCLALQTTVGQKLRNLQEPLIPPARSMIILRSSEWNESSFNTWESILVRCCSAQEDSAAMSSKQQDPHAAALSQGRWSWKQGPLNAPVWELKQELGPGTDPSPSK